MNTGKKIDINLKITAIMYSFVSILVLLVIFYVGTHKTVVIAETNGEHQDIFGEAQHVADIARSMPISMGDAGRVIIPIEEEIKAGDIVMESHYLEQSLWIYIDNAEQDFYLDKEISADKAKLVDARYGKQNNGVLFKLEMDSVYEYESEMSDGILTITCVGPEDLYDFLVVIDADYTGNEEEDDIIDAVLKYLQDSENPPDTKLYFTNSEGRNINSDLSLWLVKQLHADVFIRIGLSRDEGNEDKYGVEAYYNDTFFIPEYGNIEVSDVMVRNMAIALSNRAIGIYSAHEDNVLCDMNIPSTQINIGYVTNEEEYALLKEKDYLKKVAEGLNEGIKEVYANFQQQKE